METDLSLKACGIKRASATSPAKRNPVNRYLWFEPYNRPLAAKENGNLPTSREHKAYRTKRSDLNKCGNEDDWFLTEQTHHD
jgi:hypothetical protein